MGKKGNIHASLRAWLLVTALVLLSCQGLNPAHPDRPIPNVTQSAPGGNEIAPPIPTGRPVDAAPTTTQDAPAPAPTALPIIVERSTAGRPNPVVLENQKPGSSDWLPGKGFDWNGTHAEIAGFAGEAGVNIGEVLPLAISARSQGVRFELKVYRVGWYGGLGARLVFADSNLPGVAQGYWDLQSGGIQDCPSCEIDPQTGLVDTHWRYTYALQIPLDWTSGLYLVKLVDVHGSEAYVSFIVRDDRRSSDLLVQAPTNTYQAYNQWGGYSLYDPAPGVTDRGYGRRAAVKVSFNRPFQGLSPYSWFAVIQAVRFLESRGYDVTYTTNSDLEASPDSLLNHRGFISVGHDEYWTRGMRLAAERARDRGVNLAFFGGNDLYWQARLESDRDGVPRRTLVMYRFADLDPLLPFDPLNVTVRFVDPPVSSPQNGLTGTVFAGLSYRTPLPPWVLAEGAPPWLLMGTGLKPGDSAPALTGIECDRADDNGFSPANLIVVAASPFVTQDGQHITCNTTFYQTEKGTGVFSAGTLAWNGALDDFGHHNPGQTADRRIMKLVENLLAYFGAWPMG